MKVMYIKYEKGKRHSTIKENENVIMSTEKIITLPIKQMSTESTISYDSTNISVIPFSNSNSKISDSDFDYNVNKKITDFFFDAVHKNYLKKQKNTL